MQKIVVATPAADVNRPYTFTDGLAIERLPNILWTKALVNGSISEDERRSLESTTYWLCARKEVEHVYASKVGDELMEKVTYGAWALQIICPTGGQHTFLLFHDSSEGYDNIGFRTSKPLLNTLMGRLASREETGLEREFNLIYDGMRRAFADKIIRIQNPVVLLEHAMQADNLNISMLLSVMALDMCLMAGKKSSFVERLSGFLGPSSNVFPPDSIYRCQPSPTVADVVADVYELRNVIAHGQRIPHEPYLEPYDLRCISGERINDPGYQYVQLMQDAARFLLTSSLRRIFTENLLETVKDDKKWRAEMNVCEQLYKNSAAPAKTTKNRGR